MGASMEYSVEGWAPLSELQRPDELTRLQAMWAAAKRAGRCALGGPDARNVLSEPVRNSARYLIANGADPARFTVRLQCYPPSPADDYCLEDLVNGERGSYGFVKPDPPGRRDGMFAYLTIIDSPDSRRGGTNIEFKFCFRSLASMNGAKLVSVQATEFLLMRYSQKAMHEMFGKHIPGDNKTWMFEHFLGALHPDGAFEFIRPFNMHALGLNIMPIMQHVCMVGSLYDMKYEYSTSYYGEGWISEQRCGIPAPPPKLRVPT